MKCRDGLMKGVLTAYDASVRCHAGNVGSSPTPCSFRRSVVLCIEESYEA